MSSKFPNRLDVFETKHNATSQDDPSGDYVMAEHINDIQDAIVAIESALGTDPQGNFGSVGDRIAKIEVSSALRASSVLMYLGKPAYINGSASVEEAVGHFIKYEHVILGANAEEVSNINHQDALTIIQKAKSLRGVKFYGYIDMGVAGRTLSEIQVKINQWRNLGVDGIFCDHFGYDSGISRAKQNQILDSIHQYNMPAMLSAANPDQIFSDVGDATYNPDWVAPNIEAGDIYFFDSFAVDTRNGVYSSVSLLMTKLNKLIAYRNELGISIFATCYIGISEEKGQEYYDYAHAFAVLTSLDAFGVSSENDGAITNTARFYDWTPVMGSWYASNPQIKTLDGKIFTRETSFGSITLDTTKHVFLYKGISIPSYLLRLLPNSISGEVIQDGSIPDIKIKNYDVDRIVNNINQSTTALIDMDNIKGLLDGGGGISEDILQANILKAINAQIAKLSADTAAIGSLTAGEISTGKLSADRISASVVAAINLYAATMEVGDATIANAAIGTLSVDNMKANVIDAVNISTKDISADRLKANVVQAVNISTQDIAADRMRANVVSAINLYGDSMTVGSAKINAAVIGELVAENIKAGFIVSTMIKAGEIKAVNIAADAVDATKIKANSIQTKHIATEGLDATTIKTGYLSADRIQSRSLDADKIKARSITATEISAGAINADLLAAGAVRADKIQAGSITSEHITTGGLDAQIVNVYNSKTGETLIGAGFLRVDGLDVGVVQSDNLIANGLFLTASSAYGLKRDNQVGEVIIGSMSSTPGGHQIWKVDTQSGLVLNTLDVPGKKPFGIALNADEKYAYVTVQGNDTIAQIDLDNYVITENFLKTDKGPGIVQYTGRKLKDHKHMFVLGTDPDDMNIPDALMIFDGPPTSVNNALYMHHHIPLGNRPYDMVMDDNHDLYITMADEGHIVVISMHEHNSKDWKITGRIPITPFATDNYHGGLPGQFGLNEVTGGSSSISYQKDTGMEGHMHNHGGYGSADGSMKKYEPHGIALSTDPGTLFVVDYANNELVVIDKKGKAPYNALTGTREQGNFGQFGKVDLDKLGITTPDPGTGGGGGGGGHDHGGMVMSMAATSSPGSDITVPLPTLGPTPETTSGKRDYTNTNGETIYVRYRIPIGNAPEFIYVHMGKIFVTLSGSGKVAVLDETAIINRINEDREYYANYNEFMPFRDPPTFEVRNIDVGSRPIEMFPDHNSHRLYVVVNGQNQIVAVNMMDEIIVQRYNVGANPRGITLTEDGSTMYVANHGGSGNLSFVYADEPYIGDAYLGLEGEVNHHGAMGWMPNRSDWTHDLEGQVKSSATVEFRINEPFLNEGGYVRISAQGTDPQWATIEQDVTGVTNYSDGTNPEGTLFRHHNASALISIANGTSPNFLTQFEVDEMVPKYVVIDNQMTSKFHPIEDGIDQEYEGLEYSGITNRALARPVTATAQPVSGTLEQITNGVLDANELVVFPDGIHSVTVDLGKVYMVPKVTVVHQQHSMRTYHNTKTEVSKDGIEWFAIYDSAVDGEYPEMVMTEENHEGMVHTHMEHGKTIVFDARPVRYVRDTAGGWTEGSMDMGGMDGMDDMGGMDMGTMSMDMDMPAMGNAPTWAEIQVFGDWEVEYGVVYPPHVEHSGEPIASNGECFVTTDVPGGYIAMNLPIEFSCWSWMTYIAGPQYGTMAVEMPSLMASDHYVDQNWTYVTNVAHRHTMIFPPSSNVKANEMKGIKAGMHRVILKQSTGRVTFDRTKFEDFQFYAKSSILIANDNGPTFKRQKIVCEQAKGYKGIGRQSTEGAFDTYHVSPDTGLPDQAVAIKYRVRVRCDLNAMGGVEERGIAYITSCIMETGKLSSHWRMSQSVDVFPGTRIETWDPSQPHKTGIQHEHLANGSVRGSKIMPNAVMNHHVSMYARIAEFKLDLNWPTHGHGKYVTDPTSLTGTRFVSNKNFLDSMDGWGDTGTSTLVARADHKHTDLLQVEGTPEEGMVPQFMDGMIMWMHQTHLVSDITDLNTFYYTKDQVDARIGAGGGTGGGGTGGGDVYKASDNIFLKTNTFVFNGTSIRIKPESAPTLTSTNLLEILNVSGSVLFGVDYTGLMRTNKIILGSQAASANEAVRADRTILAGSGLTGGGDLTSNRTLAVNFGGDGVAETAARSDHSHVGYVSSISPNQSVQNNFTVNGTLWVGTSTADGNMIMRKGGVNVIQLDGAGSGELTNIKVYFSSAGTGHLTGNLRIGSLTIDSTNLVVNLNAERLNGYKEKDFVKVATIKDLGGYGVYSGLEVQARPVPDMNVVVKAGTVYTQSGGRVAVPETMLSLQQSSQNFDRIDLVYIQGPSTGANEGIPTVLSGTASATPTAPVMPTDGVMLAQVLVRAKIGSITDGWNRGSGTRDGSFEAIKDFRQWRPTRWDNEGLKIDQDIYEYGTKLADKYAQLHKINTFTEEQKITNKDGYGVSITDITKNLTTYYDADCIGISQDFYIGNGDSPKKTIFTPSGFMSTAGAAKLIISAGSTGITWIHNFGLDTNYVVNALANNPARHIYYRNQTANSIDLYIEQPFDQDIEILCSLFGY